MTEAFIIQKPVDWFANQWSGFYMITVSVMKELKVEYLLNICEELVLCISQDGYTSMIY